jgi:phage repressor protein C with HTH and peptisase S24 domain
MTPTLTSGTFVLIDPTAVAAPGDLVVCRHPSQSIDIVKRVHTISAEGLIDVRSDNAAEGTDSRHYGRLDPDHLVGVVTLILDRPLASLERSGPAQPPQH